MSVLDPNYLLSVLLVFVRISGLLMAAPFFNQQSFSVRIRVLFAFVLAYSMAGLVGGPVPAYAYHAFGFMAAIGVEALTGLVIGFTAQFLFLAVQFAGEIIGFQMALGIAQVFDPVNGQSANPMGRLLSLVFMLVFVLTDGHHMILQALEQSFVVVPLGGATLQASGPLLLDWTGDFFTLALRLAAPFMITIFLIDATLGVFARIVPQADLFSLSLPLKLSLGMAVAYVYMQNLFPIIPDMAEHMSNDLIQLIEAITP